MSVEIPGSPLSRHDLKVIADTIAAAYVCMYGLAREIHISAARYPDVDGLKVGGIPVRARETLSLNEGLVIFDGREPVPFDFEEA